MTDDIPVLKAEVEAFLLESEATRLTSDPMIQIIKVITAMRVFKAAVVSAHAPRGFEPGAERDPKQRQAIQDHRRADYEDLRQQKEQLVSFDCDYILQGQLWRINEAMWEAKILGPLYRWARQGMEFLFDETIRVDFQRLEAWDEKGQEIEHQLTAQMMEFMPDGIWPIADIDAGVLRWDSREAKMTKAELVLLSCIFKARGQYAEICDSNGIELQPEALRQAHSRIKRSLVKHNFPDIAECLERDSEYTGIRLNHRKLMEQFRERHAPK